MKNFCEILEITDIKDAYSAINIKVKRIRGMQVQYIESKKLYG